MKNTRIHFQNGPRGRNEEIPKLSLFIFMDHFNNKDEYSNQEIEQWCSIALSAFLFAFGVLFTIFSPAWRLKSRTTNTIYEYGAIMLFVGLYTQ